LTVEVFSVGREVDHPRRPKKKERYSEGGRKVRSEKSCATNSKTGGGEKGQVQDREIPEHITTGTKGFDPIWGCIQLARRDTTKERRYWAKSLAKD